MPRFAANLSMLYSEHEFLDRFEAAAADGFRAVECLFPYEYSPGLIAEKLQRHGLQLVLFNLPPGDLAAGERGLAALPGRETDFQASVRQALPYLAATGCRQLHAMAGIVAPGADRAAMRETYIRNLRAAVDTLAPLGVKLLIEPINVHDMPGYFLNGQQEAHDILDAVASPHLAVQMDLYHCQRTEGDLAARLRHYLPRVGHIQIAGVPGRHEPDEGEINYSYLFALLDELGYGGHVGCEYRPRGGTSAGLGWLEAMQPGVR